ncbi:MAG TPA: cytochrome c3 family protein, partial [Pseudomonadales bacterium]|nr:cytochrome c3 family protein [Pseudomonadales bacterium]
FDHTGVTSGCFSCHNGTKATGKPSNHILTDNICEACHSTLAWKPATVVDHAHVLGSCSSCHNGTIATGKPNTHIQTDSSCEACHSTLVWKPANVDHAHVLGTCSSCHNGTIATGKNTGHFVTTRECDSCHGTVAWSPSTFHHTSANYPGDHRGNPPCTACHTTNAEVVPWPYPAYQPDCAGCHAADYRPGAHGNKSVSVNRDCGSSGCHRVSASSWSK